MEGEYGVATQKNKVAMRRDGEGRCREGGVMHLVSGIDFERKKTQERENCDC